MGWEVKRESQSYKLGNDDIYIKIISIICNWKNFNHLYIVEKLYIFILQKRPAEIGTDATGFKFSVWKKSVIVRVSLRISTKVPHQVRCGDLPILFPIE